MVTYLYLHPALQVAAATGVPRVEELGIVANGVSGFLAAFWSSLVLCPTELVKCRLQVLQLSTAPSSMFVVIPSRTPWPGDAGVWQPGGAGGPGRPHQEDPQGGRPARPLPRPHRHLHQGDARLLLLLPRLRSDQAAADAPWEVQRRDRATADGGGGRGGRGHSLDHHLPSGRGQVQAPGGTSPPCPPLVFLLLVTASRCRAPPPPW